MVVSTKRKQSNESLSAMYPTKYFFHNLLPMHNTELLRHTKVVSSDSEVKVLSTCKCWRKNVDYREVLYTVTCGVLMLGP